MLYFKTKYWKRTFISQPKGLASFCSLLCKSIKFDVDSGITINGTNPNDDSISYAGDSRELNYIHLKIGSSKRLSIVKGTDEEDKVSINNSLTKFLKKEMNFVRDYFNKAETIELKKKDIEKDFDNLGERL